MTLYQNFQEYPPNVKDTPGLNYPHLAAMAEEERFSLGHPFFSLFPSLLYWSTIWLREHNRVCDILAKEHPNWDDERLFQTTRLIILGKLSIQIMYVDFHYLKNLHYYCSTTLVLLIEFQLKL